MAEKKKKSIFSEDFHRKTKLFGRNVRNDIDGLADRTLITIIGFTILVMFWWYIGGFAKNIFTAQWIEQYPYIPVTASYGWHVFRIMDAVTSVFLIIIWIFVFIHLWILSHTEKEEPKPVKPSKPQEVLPADMVCKYCKSIKTRVAGKEHPDKIFCKSCRKYF